MASRTVSREVGRSGCLLDDIFGGVELVAVEVEDVDSAGRLWTLCERRDVAELESMVLKVIRRIVDVYNMRQVLLLDMQATM